ncbi:MAG: hypothetical protein U1F83_13750 [Verrucomicrobiota bacterium]
MKTRAVWTVLVLAALSLCVGCGKAANKPMKPTAQTNMTNLVADCQKLAAEGATQGKEFWGSTDPLPPSIAAFSPQRVHLSVWEWATIVDIQVSGGFSHRGYLVVCTSKDPNLVPAAGRNWRITKIAPAVFEYRE